MPICPFRDDERFDPELIAIMNNALADACTTVGLKDKEDAAVRLLARGSSIKRALLRAAALKDLHVLSALGRAN